MSAGISSEENSSFVVTNMPVNPSAPSRKGLPVSLENLKSRMNMITFLIIFLSEEWQNENIHHRSSHIDVYTTTFHYRNDINGPFC